MAWCGVVVFFTARINRQHAIAFSGMCAVQYRAIKLRKRALRKGGVSEIDIRTRNIRGVVIPNELVSVERTRP